MAIVNYDWESVPDGGAATQANTGIAPYNPNPGTGGTITGSSVAAVGNRSILFTNSTTAVTVMQVPLTANVRQAVSYVVQLPATAPSQNYRLITLYNAGTMRAYVVLTSTWLLKAGGQGGSGEANLAGGASFAAYAGQFIRLEFLYYAGTTTTDGALQVRAFPSAFSATAIGTDYNANAINTGAGAVDSTQQLQIGFSAIYPTVLPHRADYLRTNDGGITFIGPPPAASVPTVSAGADQYVQAGSTVTITSTESGTFTSGAWSAIEIPAGAASPSIATPAAASTTVVVTTPGRYVFQRRLTYTGGTVDSAVTIWVYPVAGSSVSIYGEFDSSTAYVAEGSVANRTTALNDNNTGTAIVSADNPTNQEKKFILNPVGPGPISGFTQGYSRGGAVTRTVTLYKEDGTTAVDSWVQVPGAEVANIGEIQGDVDSVGLALVPALADRRALVIGFKATV